MSSPFKTPEFLALFREWNEKLKDSGFDDAEDFSLPEPALKTWHSFKWQSEAAQKREQSAKSYADLATELLHNGFPFKNDVWLRVWELHCRGDSVRKIEVTLSHQAIGYKGRAKTNVHEIIQAIQRAAGLSNG